MVPTVLEALGIEPPETIRGVTQSPIEGVSFAHTFNDARMRRPSMSPSTSRCLATARSTTTAGAPSAAFLDRATPKAPQKGRKLGGVITNEILDDLERNGWELYHVAEDPAEFTTWPTSIPRNCAS